MTPETPETPIESLTATDAPPSIVLTLAPNSYEDRVFEAGEYKGRKLAIVLYPDPRLEQVSAPVNFFGEDIEVLAADLVATATAADAAGLSAIQVGIDTRIIAVRIAKEKRFVVMVNPTVWFTADYLVVEEGCLSFPGVKEKALRCHHVTVEYQNLKGERQTMDLTIDDKATHTAAQAVQHEVEHLEGKLFLANMNLIHRDRVRLQMKQLHRRLETVVKKTGRKVSPMQFLFGYIPDPPTPEVKTEVQASPGT